MLRRYGPAAKLQRVAQLVCTGPQQGKIAVTVSAPRSWEEGAQQFRDDVAVNPADTEEAIWAFMCEARLWGAERARECFLQVCHTALGHAFHFTALPVVRASPCK